MIVHAFDKVAEDLAFWFFAYRYGKVAINLRECDLKKELNCLNTTYKILNTCLVFLMIGNETFILITLLTNSPYL
jgi:hypothetical protein